MLNTARLPLSSPAPGQALLARAAVVCITGYQRYLSPHKGFSCAYRVHHGAESCSQYVKRELAEACLAGIPAKARARFSACHAAHLALAAAAADGAAFADPGWLTAGHGVIQAGTYCIPLPGGCCFYSS